MAVVEDRLLDHGSADDILHHFRARFDAAKGLGTWVGLVRGAASKLVVREAHRGLGLRLLRMSLEHAYRAALPKIGCHIAAWELLVAHARGAKTSRELVPLIVSALDDEAAGGAVTRCICRCSASRSRGRTRAIRSRRSLFAATVAESAQEQPAGGGVRRRGDAGDVAVVGFEVRREPLSRASSPFEFRCLSLRGPKVRPPCRRRCRRGPPSCFFF